MSNIYHFPHRSRNASRKLREKEWRQAYEKLTVALLTERCRRGTLEPAVVEAMALGIGLAR